MHMFMFVCVCTCVCTCVCVYVCVCMCDEPVVGHCVQSFSRMQGNMCLFIICMCV